MLKGLNSLEENIPIRNVTNLNAQFKHWYGYINWAYYH